MIANTKVPHSEYCDGITFLSCTTRKPESWNMNILVRQTKERRTTSTNHPTSMFPIFRVSCPQEDIGNSSGLHI